MSNRNPDPELIDKERRVLELRRAGVTYEDIAKATGYATAQGAYLAYGRALKRTLNDAGADEARAGELDRLDRLQRVYWPKALDGDYHALDRVLKIMEHRAKYQGLYAPARMQLEAIVYDTNTIDGELARIRAILASNSNQPLPLGESTGETGADSE
jgi:hypothetical protein